MTRKFKVGLTMVGSFVALIGGVFGVKALTQPPLAPAQTVAERPEKEQAAKPKVEPEAKPNVQEPPVKVAPPTKSEVKPIPLDLDPPPINKPIPKPESVGVPPIGDLGLLDSTPKPQPPKEGEFREPGNLPILDSNLQQVQAINLDPVPAKPEAKKNSLEIAPIAELNPTKLDLDPVKPEPKKEVPPLNLDLDPPAPPKITGLSIPKQKDEPKAIEPKPIELIPTPEPIRINVPKKEEPKGAMISLDPPPTLKQEPIKIEDPRDLKPSGIGNRESGIGKMDAVAAPEVKPSLLQEELRTPTKPAEIPTIRIQAEPPPSEPITRVADSRMENYDEDIHRLASNERYATTKEMYKAISQRYYEDSGYETALAIYNAERKTGNGTIRIPPIEVLTTKYPTLVPKPTGRGTIQTTSATNIAPVEPTPAKVETAANQVPYTVAANGETLREIAQKMLGNPGYWTRIKDLNPSVNADERIPAGTRLFLPNR